MTSTAFVGADRTTIKNMMNFFKIIIQIEKQIKVKTTIKPPSLVDPRGC